MEGNEKKVLEDFRDQICNNYFVERLEVKPYAESDYDLDGDDPSENMKFQAYCSNCGVGGPAAKTKVLAVEAWDAFFERAAYCFPCDERKKKAIDRAEEGWRQW